MAKHETNAPKAAPVKADKLMLTHKHGGKVHIYRREQKP